MKIPPVNIFAFTAPGANYPAYISVNQDGDGQTLWITVRGKVKAPTIEKPFAMPGDWSSLPLSREQAHELGRALLQF